MILADVMDEVAGKLATIPDLRVYAYPPGAITPPAAVVSYPDVYTFDDTYQRGQDSLELPVVVLVGRPTERTTRDRLSAYVDGHQSVKAVLESGEHAAFHTLRIAEVTFDVVGVAGTDYAAALFTAQITGPGGTT